MGETDLLTVSEPSAPELQRVTSSEIKAGLRTSLAKGHQVFFEVGNDTGTKVTRHADAVAVGIWPSTGHQIHGYEIKVGRGDFLNEMKNPEKSWPVMRYCHRWSLLTPPGLVKVDELPPNWGLSTFDGKTMRAVKHAPLLKPEPVSPGFVAALVRRAGEADAGLIDAAVRKACNEMEEAHKKTLEHRLQRQRENELRRGSEALKVLDALREALGEDYFNEITAKEIASIVKALRQSGVAQTYGGVLRLAQDMEASASRIRRAFSETGFSPSHTEPPHE